MAKKENEERKTQSDLITAQNNAQRIMSNKLIIHRRIESLANRVKDE